MRKPLPILMWLVVASLSSLLCAQGVPSPATQPAGADASEGPKSPAAVIVIHGVINDYTRHFFLQSLDRARQHGAKTIVIELNTPGGLVESALSITRAIRNLDNIRTIAYINPRAYSAGSMIALACNEVILAPDAAIGDCAPISITPAGSLEPLPPTERAKAESPVLADFTASAEKNGYDPLLVRAMVQVDAVVYLIQDEAGHYKGVNDEQYRQLTAGGLWKSVPNVAQPVDSASTLLTVHSRLAIMLGLATGEAPSIEALAQQRHLDILATYEPGAGEAIIDFLGLDIVRGVLLSIFLTCLYISLHAPGHGAAEVLAVVCLSILLGVPLLTGYAQWWEIIAILFGIGLLALELFVIPGFGVTGIIGILLIIGGFILTFIGPEPGRFPISIPSMPMTWTSLQNGLLTVVGAMAASLALSTWLRRYLPKLPYFNRLILNTTVGGSETAMAGSLTNIDPMQAGPAIGTTGRAMTDLLPGGSAEFRDVAGGSHVVSVVSDSGFIARGTTLLVQEVAGSRIVVRAAPPSGAPNPKASS